MLRRCLGCMEEYQDEFEICPHCGYIYGSGAENELHLQPGSLILNRYRIGRALGFGGFGITYVAWDTLLERKVAVKEYLPSGCATRTMKDSTVTIFQGDKGKKFKAGLEKFVEEAKNLAKFQEVDGIVQIYDAVQENNTAYIIMEYLEGETLRERIKREGKIPVDEAISLMLPVLRSLEKVHEVGIIHRDIAPDNIFLCKGEDGTIQAKLLDFGAARFATTMHSHSLSVLVKQGYSPVEQYSTQGEQGAWTDVYAVAATLYHMITGEVPQDAMERYVKDEVKPIRKMGVDIAKSTETAIMNAMNITQKYRTKDAAVFVEELEADQVKRIREWIIRTDIGRWPLWMKLTSAGLAAAVCCFIIVTVVIHFDVLGWGENKIPDGMARVPNLVNMEQQEAEEALRENGLAMQITGKEYSDKIERDKVLEQDVPRGSLVPMEVEAKGEGEESGKKLQTAIGIRVSGGIQQTYVPDVVNYMEDTAKNMLSAADLLYASTTQPGDDAPGSVMSQDLAPDTKVDTGTSLNLVISSGRGFDASVTATVPDVMGQDYQKAKEQLLGNCLYIVKSETVYSETVPKNQILEQTPAAGETVNQDSTVTVKVSAGRGTTHVPDVQYREKDKAVELLESRNLKAEVEYEDSDVVEKGLVIRQTPEADAEVEIGTEVTIYISNGNDRVAAPDPVDIIPEEEPPADDSQQPTGNEQPSPSDENDKKPPADESEQKPPTDESEQKPPADENNQEPEETVPKPEAVGDTLPDDKHTTVPGVEGKSQAEAEKALKDAGLGVSVSQSFHDSVAAGNVISQSPSSGAQASPGTTVTITVSKGPQAPSGWTTDASFVDNPYYTYETKTQYRVRTRKATEKTTTSTTSNVMAGWTLYDTVQSWGDWGGWSDWTDTPIAGSDSRDVETREVVSHEERVGTRYYYYTYQIWNYSLNQYVYAWFDNQGTYYSTSSLTPFRWVKNNEETGYHDFYEGEGRYWYLDRTEPIMETRYKTQYRCRDRSLITTYYFKRTVYSNWSDWGEWEDNVRSSTDTTDVEKRTVYKYTPK